MRIEDLGLIPYRDAWKIQEDRHAQVLKGGEETLLLLEHTPVITFGRRVADAQKNLLTPPHILQQMGVEVVESDRGGDITFHGPGQLVAYPIIRLNAHALSVGAFVRKLEQAVIATLADFNIHAYKDACAIGVWVDLPGEQDETRRAGEAPSQPILLPLPHAPKPAFAQTAPPRVGEGWGEGSAPSQKPDISVPCPHEPPTASTLKSIAPASRGHAVQSAKNMPTPAHDATHESSRNTAAGEGMAPPSTPSAQCSPPVPSAKICALGVRIKRGISLHGIALNLTIDLAYFNLINPCGLSRPVTSIQNLLGQHTPTMNQLKQSLARHMLAAFA